MRFQQLIPHIPVLLVWVAVFAVSSLVVRELGFKRIRRYPLTLLVLFVSLLSLPAAGMYKASRPYRARIIAMLRKDKSPSLLDSGCPIFPPNNVWNTRASGLPLDPGSAGYIAAMSPDDPLHADFGAASGIPYVITDGNIPQAKMTIGPGAPQSEPGPYYIPDNAPVEGGGGDSHVLVVNTKNCMLYELFAAVPQGPGRWVADSAAIFDLRANHMRPDGWTSADAAGTSILAGLARYDEIEAGVIRHALRFTIRHTKRVHIWPATHDASASNDPKLPPMGLRLRLKQSVDLSGFSTTARIILTALRDYGMILSDNGGNWYITGSPDSRWPMRISRELAQVHGSDFEVVDSSKMMIRPDSAEARQ